MTRNLERWQAVHVKRARPVQSGLHGCDTETQDLARFRTIFGFPGHLWHRTLARVLASDICGTLAGHIEGVKMGGARLDRLLFRSNVLLAPVFTSAYAMMPRKTKSEFPRCGFFDGEK
jgi:hypothetical protein